MYVIPELNVSLPSFCRFHVRRLVASAFCGKVDPLWFGQSTKRRVVTYAFQIAMDAEEHAPGSGVVFRLGGYRFRLQRSNARVQSLKRRTRSTMRPLAPYSFRSSSRKFVRQRQKRLR